METHREQIRNQSNSLIETVGATLVVARARQAGRLDSGTGQARPLRPLFPARPQAGATGVETHRDGQAIKSVNAV